MSLKDYPGYNSPDFLAEQGQDKFFIKTCDEYIDFFFNRINEPAFDIGETNPKIEHVRMETGANIESLNGNGRDFNRDEFFVPRRAKTIFCFSILEHLTNPQFFLEQITKNMQPETILYLSTPGRWGMLQNKDCHFHEIKPAKIKRWIFEPLGLDVLRMARIKVHHPWYFYFLGVRPILRLFFDFTNIYELIKKQIGQNNPH